MVMGNSAHNLLHLLIIVELRLIFCSILVTTISSTVEFIRLFYHLFSLDLSWWPIMLQQLSVFLNLIAFI